MGQISMFDGAEPLKITKPIRLIELFAGIGAQAASLRNLGANFEHYRICEFDKYAVASYNAVHGTNFSTSDVTKIHAEDLGIVDRDKYCYIMTYSFPCTDLSLAGKMQGMQRDSGTRSGLLWEVERLLRECGKDLPQLLLMENVTQVHGTTNKDDFDEWVNFLYDLWYNNKWFDLNGKDFGVPQNRDRCFMVSWLGDYYYEKPTKQKLTLRLKDVLEQQVDEKYYLGQEIVDYFDSHTQECKEKGNGFAFAPTDGNCCGKAVTTREGGRMDDNFIYEPIVYDDYNGHVKADQSCINTLTTNCGNGTERNGVKICEPIAIDEQNKCTREETFGTLTTDGSSPKHNNRVGEPIKCDVLFELQGGKWDNVMDMTKRVYGIDGLSPTLTIVGGGNTEKKIAIPIQQVYDMAKKLYPTRGIWEYNGWLYWVRKLTPRECWRLMGFTDDDFDKAQAVNSNSQLYKQAGNSIVTTVLMALFGQMLGIDWQTKVHELVDEITNREETK